MTPIPSQARETNSRSGPVGRGLIAVVQWYRDVLSAALPPRCRFYPTCSAYTVTALTRYGAARGSWLALRRIVRCGPWHPGGVDHVPPRKDVDHVPPRKDVGPQRRPIGQETAVA